FLGDPGVRPVEAAAWLAPSVAAAEGVGLVVETRKRDVELYPVRAGVVLESAAVAAPLPELPAALDALAWPDAAEGEDWPWLSAWIHAKHPRGGYLPVADATDRRKLLAQVQRALGAPCAE